MPSRKRTPSRLITLVALLTVGVTASFVGSSLLRGQVPAAGPVIVKDTQAVPVGTWTTVRPPPNPDGTQRDTEQVYAYWMTQTVPKPSMTYRFPGLVSGARYTFSITETVFNPSLTSRDTLYRVMNGDIELLRKKRSDLDASISHDGREWLTLGAVTATPNISVVIEPSDPAARLYTLADDVLAQPVSASVTSPVAPIQQQPVRPVSFDGFCGDGTEQASEECDDGNPIHGDGCTARCELEQCGNGIINYERGETCDDGNTRNSDGCSSVCRVQTMGVPPVAGTDVDAGITVSLPVTVNRSGTLPVSVTVNTAQAATDLMLDIPFGDPGLSFEPLGSDSACATQPGGVACSVGTVNPGQSRMLTVNLRMDGSISCDSMLRQWAMLSSTTTNDTNASNNLYSATTTVTCTPPVPSCENGLAPCAQTCTPPDCSNPPPGCRYDGIYESDRYGCPLGCGAVVCGE